MSSQEPPRQDPFASLPQEPTQIAIAVVIEGVTSVAWDSEGLWNLTAELGHPERSAGTGDIGSAPLVEGKKFLTFGVVVVKGKQVPHTWRWMTAPEISEEVKEQSNCPLLLLRWPTPRRAFLSAGALAKQVNALNHPYKGGTVKMIVLGATANPGGAIA